MARARAAVDWAALQRVTLVGCGTAFYACMVARRWFEAEADLFAAVAFG
jgi:glucosamine--fructose-6-phosphate aminotransferase (isomerizing)